MKKQTALWTTKSGERIRICDMSDQHLNNTMALLERYASKMLSEERNAAYSVLASLQGEMAQYYCEQDIDRLEETEPSDWLYEHMPIYEKMCHEKWRRESLLAKTA